MKRLALWLALATMACVVPATPAPTTAPPTVAPALATPLAGATSQVAAFSGEAVTVSEESLAQGNPFAPFPAPPRTVTASGNARDGESLPKLESIERLNAAQQEALLAQGFVINPQPFDSFAAAYAYGGEQKIPAFITGDAILQATRILIDVTWQRTEGTVAPADLQGLCQTMVEVSQAQWEAAADDQTVLAARRNMGFFAVCSSLLDAAYRAPAPVSDVTAEEMTLIAQGGRFLSPLFGQEEDYSRFIAFGHYAQSEDMARTFRALSWLARPFSLDYEPQDGSSRLQSLQEARLAALQALQMVWGLKGSNNISRWERLFQPGLFFYGAPAAWSVTHVQAAARPLYGETRDVTALSDVALLDDFLATIHTLPPSLPFETTVQPTFAFLAAPGIAATKPDAAILRELVFNRVGAYVGPQAAPRTALQTDIGAIRGLPRTLDVAVTLGSEAAQTIVAADGDAAYDGYTTQLERLQTHFASIDVGEWTRSLDGGWLYALQPLLAPVDAEGFLYAPPGAWQARQLYGWHGAWMALRHETKLAPRPVSAVGVSPDVAYGYLEPLPLLYGRLASLTAQVLEGLDTRGMLEQESAGKLRQLLRLLEAAEDISRKELAGERLTVDEATLLSQFMTRLNDLTTFAPQDGVGAAQTAGGPQRLVDVYQEPSSGSLLQAASGEVWPIYVLVPREQDVILTMGGVLSTYELHGEQIGESTWRDMENRPPPPAWMQEVVVGE